MGQVPSPDKLRLYRITHYENLPDILRRGMYARNHASYSDDYVGIGNPTLTRDRTTRIVPGGAGGSLNDYVPFYLGPRSPMLYCIWRGYEVPQRPQRDIVYVISRFDQVLALDLPFAYTNGHAYQLVSKFFFDRDDLGRVDWQAVQAPHWSYEATGDRDFKRRKQAEFLIHAHVPIEAIGLLVVMDEERRRDVEEMVAAAGRSIPVRAVPSWYY